MRSLLPLLVLVTLLSAPARAASAAVIDDGAPSLVLTGAAPAPAPSPDVEEESEVWMFLYAVNEWYPIVLDPHLEPEVEEKVVWLWITTAVCGPFCGPLWIPMVIVGENPGIEYFVTEALFAILFEWITYAIGGASSAAFGLGTILITANLLYLAPVGLINGYDRALKRERARTPALIFDDDDDAPAPKAKPKPKPNGTTPNARAPRRGLVVASMAY